MAHAAAATTGGYPAFRPQSRASSAQIAAGGGSQWWGCSTKYVPPAPAAIPSFLEPYGYLADDAGTWRTKHPGAKMELSVTSHKEFEGYTLYNVDCALVVPIPQTAEEKWPRALRLTWTAKRRLAQLREELHDRVKVELGERDYALHFGMAPFAQRGSLTGTTSRLDQWCKALAGCVNKGTAPPTTVALLLHYLQAPEPVDPEAEKDANNRKPLSRPCSRGGGLEMAHAAAATSGDEHPAFRSQQARPGKLSQLQAGGGSQWWGSARYVPPAPAAIPSFLEPYGYLADDAGTWRVPRPGAQMELSVTGHVEFQGYTLYRLDCALVVPLPQTTEEGSRPRALRMEWTAKRRLAQLREELHDRVKQELEDLTYALHFGMAPFAQRGALTGTTSRLDHWFKALAGCVNQGGAPPTTVALLLHYLQAPEPKAEDAEDLTEVAKGQMVSTPSSRSTAGDEQPDLRRHSGSGRLSQLTAGGGPFWWGETTYVPVASVAVPSFLEPYGYLADGVGKWRVTRPCTQIELSVTSHEEFQGYTLYKLECALAIPSNEKGDQASEFPRSSMFGSVTMRLALRMEWTAKRRLAQLRHELHDRAKQELGERAYALHFGTAPFAQTAGPAGTTARLDTWCKALAACVNQGAAPPSTVALLLHYLQAPEPIDPEAEDETEVSFRPGEDAEVMDLLPTNEWLRCRITGAGTAEGSYNIRVLPSPASRQHGMAGQERPNIALDNLRKCARAYAPGEDVEVLDFRTNEWLGCRIVSKGSEFGTFNLRVQSSEAAEELGLADKDRANVSAEDLRKAPCAYEVGEYAEVLDLRTSAWVRCMVTGADVKLGTYNIRVLPCEAARLKNLVGKEGTGIDPEQMRQVPRHRQGGQSPVKAGGSGLPLFGASGLLDVQFRLEDLEDAEEDSEEGARPAETS